jgi:hypothetical protein
LALGFLGKSVYAERFLDLLQKFPSQSELQRAAPRKLAEWFRKLRRAGDDPPAEPAQDERIRALKQAPPLVTDQAVLRHGRLAVKNLGTQLQQLNETIAEYDREIATLVEQHPDAKLFASFDGARRSPGAPARGSLRHRPPAVCLRRVQQLSGIAPSSSRAASPAW